MFDDLKCVRTRSHFGQEKLNMCMSSVNVFGFCPDEERTLGSVMIGGHGGKEEKKIVII